MYRILPRVRRKPTRGHICEEVLSAATRMCTSIDRAILNRQRAVF